MHHRVGRDIDDRKVLSAVEKDIGKINMSPVWCDGNRVSSNKVFSLPLYNQNMDAKNRGTTLAQLIPKYWDQARFRVGKDKPLLYGRGEGSLE